MLLAVGVMVTSMLGMTLTMGRPDAEVVGALMVGLILLMVGVNVLSCLWALIEMGKPKSPVYEIL